MDIINLILLGIVAVIFWRLFRVLGRRTGFERPPQDLRRLPDIERGKETPRTNDDNVVPLPGSKNDGIESAQEAHARGTIKPSDPLGQTLTEIALIDRAFEMSHFLSGARAAYAMIITDFAKGDREGLRPLLADEVYEKFEAAISAREAAEHHAETRPVGEIQARVVDARLENKDAYITVRFTANIVSFTRDRDDRLIEGNPQTARSITDVWTFARSLKSRDPNWILVATESSDDTAVLSEDA